VLGDEEIALGGWARILMCISCVSRVPADARHGSGVAAYEAGCGSVVLMRMTKDGVLQVTDPHQMATLRVPVAASI
jgi:hypothetical protein